MLDKAKAISEQNEAIEMKELVIDLRPTDMPEQAINIGEKEISPSFEILDQEPFVVFTFSESKYFEENETLSFKDADKKIK